ncbi:hypothetical protein ACHQM5_011074 [Ranunculus cassubicifolius]
MVTSPKSPNTVKFLCSYNGKILPRHPDGKLRYFGGETRVLAVDRSISFAELLIKMGELYGSSVSLRCQLPEEDLDALISITCDEDLANVIEEYDLASQIAGSSIKIRAFLWPPKSIKKISPPPSATSSTSDLSPGKYFYQQQSVTASGNRLPPLPQNRYVSPTQMPPIGFPVGFDRTRRSKLCYYSTAPQPNPRHSRPLHNGNHWQ